MVNCDICSDLHIDQWNKNLEMKYPCGIRTDSEYKWNKTNNKILIIAGDVSDNLDLSIDYIDNISEYYDKILYVDGNHEHVEKYPELYTKDYINQKIKVKKNDKLVYLPSNDYIIDNIVFIGCCGWWDYNNFDINAVMKSIDYFKNWIDHFVESECRDYIYNVYERSKLEYKDLINKLLKYQNDERIESIVIVTHSQSKKKFVELDLATEFNNNFENITNKKFNKLKYWIFGHTHKHILQNDDINYICNPRGRPEDYNRETYNLYSITI